MDCMGVLIERIRTGDGHVGIPFEAHVDAAVLDLAGDGTG